MSETTSTDERNDGRTDGRTGFLADARHPVNIGHLVMGIAFLGLVAVWALIASDVVEGGDVRWLMPVPWVFAGIAGLLATVLTARKHATRQSGWVGDDSSS